MYTIHIHIRCPQRFTEILSDNLAQAEAVVEAQVSLGHHPDCWLFRTLRATLSTLQNFLTQEREPTSTIHGTLNILEFVDLALNGSIPVRQR